MNINKLRKDYEKPFWNIMEGLERSIDPNNITWWKKNGYWYLYQDEKIGCLNCNYTRVWSVLSKHYDLDYEQTQVFIRDMMDRHFKLGHLTPQLPYRNDMQMMDRHFKLGHLTPGAFGYRFPRWIDTTN